MYVEINNLYKKKDRLYDECLELFISDRDIWP